MRGCLLAAAVLGCLTGCRILSTQGPVSRSVATCRQFTQQGRSALDRGEWERAESLFARAVESCPSDTEARRNYAETLWHRGAGDQAIAQLVEAWKSEAHDPAMAVRAGEMYLATGQSAAARHAAEEAIALDPRSAAAWALRGRTAQAEGNARAALADFQRSLGFASDNPAVLLNMAEAYRQLGQPDRALASLDSLLDRYGPGEETQQALYLKGLALSALGRNLEACDSYRLALQRGRPTAELYFRLGQSELAAGSAPQARAAIEQALALEPGHRPSHALAGRLEIAARPPAEPLVRR